MALGQPVAPGATRLRFSGERFEDGDTPGRRTEPNAEDVAEIAAVTVADEPG